MAWPGIAASLRCHPSALAQHTPAKARTAAIFADDEMETTPWENLERYMQHSPISYVKNMHTPLLIIHSEQDLRCNIEQAEQLFAALKWMGREVQFVRFEGQSHGLSRGGHPKLRQERLRHILNWFAKYLPE